jgi:putative restriction endonuclease
MGPTKPTGLPSRVLPEAPGPGSASSYDANPVSQRSRGHSHAGTPLDGTRPTDSNLALAHSCKEGLPVRVIRGSQEPSGLGPESGFRYDGLYRVDEYSEGKGQSGFRVWRFRLIPYESAAQWVVTELPASGRAAQRRTTEVQRIVRNTEVVRRVKRLHKNVCQICGLTLDTPGGPYSEGAHIRPLGAPHDGPDAADNVLCLCPNDHVRFDSGAITVSAGWEVVTLDGSPQGELRRLPAHPISADHLAYHRYIHGYED